MQLDIVYLDDQDAFEITFQESGRQPYTLTVRNAEGLDFLVAGLTAAKDLSGGSRWELHLGYKD